MMMMMMIIIIIIIIIIIGYSQTRFLPDKIHRVCTEKSNNSVMLKEITCYIRVNCETQLK